MEILYWVVGIIWCIGALAEIAKFNRKVYVSKISKPYTGAFASVWVLLVFIWPYWYFYEKGV